MLNTLNTIFHSLPSIHKLDCHTLDIRHNSQHHRGILKCGSLVLVQKLKHTVDTGGFSSQTSGNAFGISWVTISDTLECFFNTNFHTNSIEFEIPWKQHVTILFDLFYWNLTVLTDNLDLPFDPLDGKRPGPAIVKRRISFLNIWSIHFVFIERTAVLFSWALCFS